MNTMQPVTAPQWLINFYSALDTLDLSPASGFSCMDEQVSMVFGSKVVNGLDNVKQFFATLDQPLQTKHSIIGVWQVNNSYVVQCNADIRRKTDPVDKTVQAMAYNIFWLSDAGKVLQYTVSSAPNAGASLGIK